MTPLAFWHTERYDGGDHRNQTRKSMHDERKEEGELGAKDERAFLPPDRIVRTFRQVSPTSYVRT